MQDEIVALLKERVNYRYIGKFGSLETENSAMSKYTSFLDGFNIASKLGQTSTNDFELRNKKVS